MFAMGSVHSRDNDPGYSGADSEHAAKQNEGKGLISMPWKEVYM